MLLALNFQLPYTANNKMWHITQTNFYHQRCLSNDIKFKMFLDEHVFYVYINHLVFIVLFHNKKQRKKIVKYLVMLCTLRQSIYFLKPNLLELSVLFLRGRGIQP